MQRMQFQHAEAPTALAEPEPQSEQQVREAVQPVAAVAPMRAEPKIGRNAPCPCGSGKKYKHCHGRVD